MFHVLDEMSELVYVTDMDNYDLLYLNQSGKKMFGIDENAEAPYGKCHKILQGNDEPCDFCTNEFIREDDFYTWEKTNQVTGRHFLLKDRIIDWEGRPARVEIAFDMTQQEEQRQSIQELLDMQNLITECAGMLSGDADQETIRQVLEKAGEYLGADRCCIFEANTEKETISNTGEWYRKGLQSEMKDLRDIPWSVVREWSGDETQITAPLYHQDQLIGYARVRGVSEERSKHAKTFVEAIGFFLASTISRRRALNQLRRMSYYDDLTDLKNRNAFLEDQKIMRRFPVGIISIDVNGMKKINDRSGVQKGDEALITIAQALQHNLSDGDCYRMGSDEFVAICENIERSAFNAKVQHLKNYFSFHSEYDVAIGTIWEGNLRNLRDMVFQANEAMYEDKKEYYRGKGLVDSRYRSRNDDILGITDPEVLQRRIEEGQFMVYYQPQIDAETREITGAESLIRFMDEKGNFYAPDQFISVLEEARLISVLDFYAFEQVCQRLQRWRSEGRPIVPVSSNFSRYTLSERDFVDRLEALCNQYDIPKELVEVEMTETVEADDREAFDKAVEELNRRNFRIAIDDFGVRNANMSLLAEVEFHVLKIDKNLIDTIEERQKTQQMLEALFDVSHKMGIRIVAEGVETEGQYALLRGIGCDTIQGYLFSKPLPEEQFCNRYLTDRTPTK